jgi:hypothetical protein
MPPVADHTSDRNSSGLAAAERQRRPSTEAAIPDACRLRGAGMEFRCASDICGVAPVPGPLAVP